MKTGLRNLITDVAGLSVGNATDRAARTGVTVLVPDAPAIAAVHVMGGAPGTRETDLLSPEQTVERVDALVLSGGSGFGLEAASGVMAGLVALGRGFPVGSLRVPIVPAAILFDLGRGEKPWAQPGYDGPQPPYRDLGRKAFEAAAPEFALGKKGAGIGAKTASGQGGLGSASTVLDRGYTIGALAAVNALGSPFVGSSHHYWAAPFEIGDEYGGLGFPHPLPDDADRIVTKLNATARDNTTIAIVATDASLTKAQAKRLAMAAHDGFARALWPAHAPLDGDLVFALSTGARPLTDPVVDMTLLCAVAAATMARAIARGVYEASKA